MDSVFQPSILRITIWPDASKAQNSIAAVSADGSTVCVLIRRLNSSCRRSMAFVVRALFHCDGGSAANANNALRLAHPWQAVPYMIEVSAIFSRLNGWRVDPGSGRTRRLGKDRQRRPPRYARSAPSRR